MNQNNEILNLELKISNFLRKGVFSSAILMAIGWFYMAITNAGSFSHLKSYEKISFITSFTQAISQEQYGQVLIYAGLIILISLPIIRVLLTAILFLKQKDKLLGVIALFVLLALVLSLVLGFEL